MLPVKHYGAVLRTRSPSPLFCLCCLTGLVAATVSASWSGWPVAWGLAAYYEKIVANKDDFPAKSVGKPLLICLLIFVPLIASLIYLMTLDGGAAGTTI